MQRSPRLNVGPHAWIPVQGTAGELLEPLGQLQYLDGTHFQRFSSLVLLALKFLYL